MDEQLEDDLIFISTEAVQNYWSNNSKFEVAPDQFARDVFYTVWRALYSYLSIGIIDYEPLNKFLLTLGPQMLFVSWFTKSSKAVLMDTISIFAIFVKDIIKKENL